MTEESETTWKAAASRRNFMKLAGAGGFTAAVMASAAGMLWSTEAAAQMANEERDREKAAEHVMTLATAYVMTADRSYPIMQLDLKENIQNATRGKVYVKLAPAGQLGAANELVQKVQSGTIQAAQHSIANFAPFAPVVDLINLPYLCGSNQRFINLTYSDVWKDRVHPQVEARGFKTLFYAVIDPRVVAIRKGGPDAVLTPGDLKGVKFRVPGSEMLQTYYRLVGANPTPIAWGETPSAIQQGVADALDPAVGALYVFGFKDMLSHITFTQAVPDAQVYSCNLEWYNALPEDVRAADPRGLGAGRSGAPDHRSEGGTGWDHDPDGRRQGNRAGADGRVAGGRSGRGEFRARGLDLPRRRRFPARCRPTDPCHRPRRFC
ncbi:TRAP-type C4-dicarboxylate transport system substrate-binding protein [Paracoccus lutimaris]|uniref:TRAP-type C4-dicarboxylate transport system substrate-binding protein n=1 Tax=Paracoccus lutimaris TaxID=1490030 RepID=A0A368YTA4_9RHOB|nr:TRAP-type C4-dicarboxylate transport system substrate-binding protein [Paracoccus lutimaris]